MTTTPQDAAMLVLIRDCPGAGSMPEVLLVKRPADDALHAGAYAFPGGMLEPDDSIPPALALSREFTAAEAAVRIPDVEPASRLLGLWIAALRETFETAGILLARYGDGRLWEPNANDLQVLARQRQALQQGRTNFPNMMHDLERALATDLLIYFAHGITPEGRPQRFSTRFFLAHMPSGVSPLPDQSEGIEQLWVTPEEMLQQHANGTLALLSGATHILQILKPFPSAAAASEHFRLQPIATVLL
jgi:8-oxo-dGTP pyrophosphatase MutT (NUDIX family)